MLKLTLFEVFIVSLQTLPLTQLTLMFISQLVTIFIIAKGFFYDKIYIHKVYGISDLFTEWTILFYFIIGLLSSYYGEDINSKEWFLKIQLAEIYLILITAAINMVQVVYHGILSGYNFWQQRRFRVKKEPKLMSENEPDRKKLMNSTLNQTDMVNMSSSSQPLNRKKLKKRNRRVSIVSSKNKAKMNYGVKNLKKNTILGGSSPKKAFSNQNPSEITEHSSKAEPSYTKKKLKNVKNMRISEKQKRKQIKKRNKGD